MKKRSWSNTFIPLIFNELKFRGVINRSAMAKRIAVAVSYMLLMPYAMDYLFLIGQAGKVERSLTEKILLTMMMVTAIYMITMLMSSTVKRIRDYSPRWPFVLAFFPASFVISFMVAKKIATYYMHLMNPWLAFWIFVIPLVVALVIFPSKNGNDHNKHGSNHSN